METLLLGVFGVLTVGAVLFGFYIMVNKKDDLAAN